jgi:hypothetical protein
MRRHEPIDPVAERDLEALEAALSGAPGADPELRMLTEELRAIAPAYDPGARAALDARVAAGFPRPERGRRRPWAAWRPALLLPAGGVLAAALVALVVGLGGGSSQHEPVASSAPSVAAPEAATRDSAGSSSSSSSTVAPSIAPTTSAPLTGAPKVAATPGRRVERGVQLDLGVRPDRFDAVTDGVVRVTQRRGGFVGSSQIGRGTGGGNASFALRIPTSALDAAVADLSRLAHVRSIQQSSQDLTGSYDSAAARLRDGQTRRRAIVAALATATGARETRLRARLDEVTAQLTRLDRELAALRSRTSYSTIDLSVTAAKGAAVVPGDGRWTPGDAWRDARRGLEVAAGVAIVAAALLVPAAIAAGLLVVLLGGLRRRRREAML